MANNYLMREDAPIQPETWALLDSIVTETARSMLVGRHLLHIEGPYGLGLKAIPMGDPALKDGQPVISPLVPLAFIQCTFSLARRDLAAFERDKTLLDTREVGLAAVECARKEDELLFRGFSNAPGLLSIAETSSSELSGWEQVGTAADDIIRAVSALDSAGFHGPYALALTTGRYNALLRRYPNGFLSELDHIKIIAADGVFKGPVIEGGGVLVASGRQFASIILGQDMSVGFIGPVGERLEFSISESLALIVQVPRAICVLHGLG